ncbi:MAG TPA: hypothetical protein VK894_11150 [Jiangellales bacterium]|nr:hypothetical protein [Jiangellales bacterium]
MRTTVTLDDDTEQLIRERMAQRGISFKQALNDSIRDGNRRRGRRPLPATTTASMGTPAVNLDRALQIAAELEDEELIRRMRSGG